MGEFPVALGSCILLIDNHSLIWLLSASVEASAAKTFGDLSLIVLTANLNNISGWQEWQTELLQLSSNSQQLFAESGHNIHFEKPDVAVAAILQMVEQVRQSTQK